MPQRRSLASRLESTLKLLPDPAKRAVKAASGPPDAIFRRLYRRRTGDTAPIPPARLRARIGTGARVSSFVESGEQAVDAFAAVLEREGRLLADAATIYDWGCGCGRLLRHLDERARPGTRIIGTDVDPEAIAWAARAWPHMDLRTNRFKPPLPVQDGVVDVLISSSIFTHLTESDQDQWLAEVQRVLAPDGIALITVAGPRMQDWMRTEEATTRSAELMSRLAALEPVGEDEFQFIPYEVNAWNRPDFSGITDVYGLAFHGHGYVREHWKPWLEVRHIEPAATNSFQDIVAAIPARG